MNTQGRALGWIVHRGYVVVQEFYFYTRLQARAFVRLQRAEGWQASDLGIYRSENGILTRKVR